MKNTITTVSYTHLFLIFQKTLCSHNLVQSIVQRTQIWIDLTLEITRKKSEFLTCLNGRSRQDNPADFLIFECSNCHCHRQICFSGTRRSDSKYDHFIANLIYIVFLTQRFWFYRFSLNCMTDNLTVCL